jgi:Na+-driven multidrug efflux pump
MVSLGTNFIAIHTFCLLTKSLRPSFFWFTRDSFREIKEYLVIGLPNAAMLCFEWGGFEVLALIASAISVNALAAQVVSVNTLYVLMMIPYGG